MKSIKIELPHIEGIDNEMFAKGVESLAEDIKCQLLENETAWVYASKLWRAGVQFKALGKAFKQAGYHCAINYICGDGSQMRLQSLMVSKKPVGEPSGTCIAIDLM